jgi:hypothetical protein
VSNSPANSNQLLHIAHEQLALASNLYRYGRRLQMATLVSGVTITFLPGIAYFGAIATLLFQGAALYLRQRGQQKQGIGDEIRRRGLMLDALGHFDQSYDLSELLRKVGDDARARAADRAEVNHFASSAHHGWGRLRDHLRENAFWNRCLYHEAARRGISHLAFFGATCIVVALLSVALVPQGVAIDTMRVFVLIATFLIAFTLLTDTLAWRSASRAIEVLDRKLDTMKNTSDSDLRDSALGDLQVILAEYAVATSKIAPIPDSIYMKHRDQLNRAWNERENEIRDPLI